MSSNTKRTRSQGTLPNFFPSLERSPLKEARTAARTVNALSKPTTSKNIFPRMVATANAMDEDRAKETASGAEDQTLRKTKKRPSSERGIENQIAAGGGEERNSKRARTEEPSLLAKDTRTPSKKPLSTADSTSYVKPITPSRARSVPPPVTSFQTQLVTPPTSSESFSSSTVPVIPHLDLTKVTPSPRKSPSKDRLRITSLLQEHVAEDQGTPALTKTPKVPQSTSPQKPLAELAFTDDPSRTPGHQFNDTTPSSPLTPVPPTPFLHGPRPAGTVGRSGLRAEIEDENMQGSEDVPTSPIEGRASSPTPFKPAELLAHLPSIDTRPDQGAPMSTSDTTPDSTDANDRTAPAPPGPSRLPRRSLAPPVVAAPTSTAKSEVPAPASSSAAQQPSKKHPSTGAIRTKTKDRAAKDKVLGSGRVTRSVALRMKANSAYKTPSSSSSGARPESQPANPSTPSLSKRKSFSFSFAVPTASSLSKTKPPAPPTTPGKRPSTPGKPLPLIPGTNKTPTKPSSTVASTSAGTGIPIPRPAASVAPVEQKSSLSNLSMALEKLSLPPPSRPSTSLGFNHGDDDDKSMEATVESTKAETQDDLSLGSRRKSIGPAGLKRSATVGSLEASTSLPELGPSKAAPESTVGVPAVARVVGLPEPVAKPVTADPSVALANKKATLDSWLTKARTANGLPRPARSGAFGGGLSQGRPSAFRQKLSRQPALPVIEGSPVKGGVASFQESPGEVPDKHTDTSSSDAVMKGEDVFGTPVSQIPDDSQVPPSSEKGKEKEADGSLPARGGPSTFRRDASRRASLASQALSQSLSSLPQTPSAPGTMGPPPVPSGSGKMSKGAGGGPPPSSFKGVSGSNTTVSGRPVRAAAAAAAARSAPGLIGRGAKGSGNANHVSAGRKTRAESAPPESPAAAGGLDVLKDCTIFVDVRTDDGDDAGSLFVEMLMGLGAKILSRVGKSCTHIVFKNGLMSTVTGYKLLSDPKPHVVGIAWVVECVEQRAKAEESRFIVDLDGLGVAGTTKRRRASMLPKHIPVPLQGTSHPEPSPTTAPVAADTCDNGDQSMDSSSSTIVLDEGPLATGSQQGDSLPPLERARRRRSTLFGQS